MASILKKMTPTLGNYKFATAAFLSRCVYYSLRLLGFPWLFTMLGVDAYAIFMVLISLEGWCMNFDFGLGYVFQNTLSASRVQKIDIETRINGIFRLAIGSTLFFLVMVLLGAYRYAPFLFSEMKIASSEAIFLTGCAGLLYLGYALGNIAYKGMFAHHLGHRVYLFWMLGSILSFCGLIATSWFVPPAHQLVFALLSWLSPLSLLGVGLFIWTFASQLDRRVISWKSYYKTISIGFRFFLYTIFSGGVVYIDYFVMSKTLSSMEIASYSIMQKAFSAFFFVFWAMLLALWPKCSEWLHQGEFRTPLEKTYRLIYQGWIWMIGSGLGFYFLQKLLIQLFFKGNITPLDFWVIGLFVLYFVVRIVPDAFGMLLQSINRVDLFLYVLPIQFVLSLVFQWSLSARWGIIGIPVGMLLSYLVTVFWMVPMQFFNLSRKQEKSVTSSVQSP